MYGYGMGIYRVAERQEISPAIAYIGVRHFRCERDKNTISIGRRTVRWFELEHGTRIIDVHFVVQLHVCSNTRNKRFEIFNSGAAPGYFRQCSNARENHVLHL